jgi:glycosyltransferase involved in cell wall biosynthesis
MSEACVIMPMYNDWTSAAEVVKAIDAVISGWESAVTVIIVNDGSQESPHNNDEFAQGCSHIKKVHVIDLVCNQGHQRAIAIGLVYAHQQACFDRVFVMDSDGEDRPAELTDLLAASQDHPDAIITADRVSRSEGALFKFCYRCYKSLFSLLTGTHIRFGNFCVIPAQQLDRLVYYPSLWNSFSGTIKKSNLPRQGIPSHRGTRYAGLSKMNFVALVLHGLGVISVYWDVLLVRCLCGVAMLWLITGAWVAAMLPIGLTSGVGLWGLGIWSVSSVILGVGVFFLLHHLNARATAPFVPAWHAAPYIGVVRELKSD